MPFSLPRFLYRFIPGLGHVIHPGNFHPVGARRTMLDAFERARAGAPAPSPGAGGRWLVVGGSGGFGSAARVVLGAAHGAHTLDLSLDAAPNPESSNKLRRLGSPGWHRARALDELLRAEGLTAASLSGDVLDPACPAQVAEAVREHLGELDGIVWSLAAPRGLDPRTGETVRSALKPYGREVAVKTFANRDAGGVSRVVSVTLPPGTPEEAIRTQHVMGGGVVERFVMALAEAGVLARGFQLATLSYRGNPLNAAIYREGLIGLAKADLEFQTRAVGAVLGARLGGRAVAVCGPAVVTEASGGIPGVPFYMALLLDVMGAAHEDPVASMTRLFAERLSPTGAFEPVVDDEGLVRMDERELAGSVQEEMARRHAGYAVGDRFEDALFDRFMTAYAQTRGFAIEGVDYAAEIDPDALA